MSSTPSSTAESQRPPRADKTPPPRWSKPIEWWATRQLLTLLRLLGAILPLPVLRAMGRGLGIGGFYAMRRYRVVTLENLRRAFGNEWGEEQIQATARESFRNLGVTLVDFLLRQPRITPEEVLAEVEFVGKEHYEAAFARGKGILLITAHYGNWEM